MSRDVSTPLDMTQNKILLGAHMSIGGGVHTAIERGCSIKCTATIRRRRG